MLVRPGYHGSVYTPIQIAYTSIITLPRNTPFNNYPSLGGLCTRRYGVPVSTIGYYYVTMFLYTCYWLPVGIYIYYGCIVTAMYWVSNPGYIL